MLGAPGMDAVFQVRSHESGVKGQNPTKHYSDLFPSIILFPPFGKIKAVGLWISR